jgi:O-antigen ligase
MLAPGALTVVLAFHAGGFFPGTTALVAVVLLLGLVVHVTVAGVPFSAVNPFLVVAAGALALLAVWTLLSQAWSDSPVRALLEFDRVLLYLAALVLFGAARRAPDDLRWLVRGLAAAALAVCTVALVTRLAPDVWPIGANLSENRLSYPVTYWNALGLVAALGVVSCVHLAACGREPRVSRVLAAAAMPILAATLFFTLSRGAMAAAILGLAVYAVVGRPAGLLTAAVAIVPTVTVTVVAAYDADLLTGDHPTSAAATAQGHDVALVVGLCVLGAGVLRTLLLPVDARLARLRLPAAWHTRRTRVAGRLGAAAIAVAVVAGLGLPGEVRHQYDRFIEGTEIRTEGDLRQRLTDPGNNGRLPAWQIAVRGFTEDRLHGRGAGTFDLEWDQHRGPLNQFELADAHSLYVEVLHELGLPGLVLVVVAVLALLAAFAARARGPDRAVGAVLLAAGTMWAVHAGVDWDWEMPVVSLWFFAAGGIAAAAAERPSARHSLGRLPRVGLGLVVLLLAVTPAQTGLSEVHVHRAAVAFQRGDCAEAVDESLAAAERLDVRPEPYEVMAFCDVRAGLPQLAVRAAENAVERDPRNWEMRYTLALARGAAGLDPRAEAREAARLNPREPLTQDAVKRFDTRSPQEWRRRALRARLPN